MKWTLPLLILCAAITSGFAQGAVHFSNRPLSGDAPVTLLDRSGPGPLMVAGLYLVREGGLELLKTLPFRNPGSDPRHAMFLESADVTVPGVPIRAPATFRVRVWDAKFPTYEAAVSGEACCGELRTTNANNDVYVPELGDPDPPGGSPLSLPFPEGLLPLELPCLRSATNSNVLVPSVKLLVRLEERGVLALEVATSFPGESTVIETSQNLRNWSPVRTNAPGATSFQFEENIDGGVSGKWYRAVVRSD
jgi:hypothetical protein